MGKRGPKPGSGTLGESVNLRLDDGLRRLLAESADHAGRKISDEIRTRLRVSFSAAEFRDPLTKGLVWLIAEALDRIEIAEAHPWHETQRSFLFARDAILEILTWFEPDREGIPNVPDDHPILESLRTQGLTDHIAETKRRLQKSDLGTGIGKLVVALCDTVADGILTQSTRHLEAVAPIVKAKLDALQNAGCAAEDLKLGAEAVVPVDIEELEHAKRHADKIAEGGDNDLS